MLGRLTKLASRSAQLRKIAMEKQAILGAAVKGLAGAVAKNPGTAAAIGISGLSAGQAVAEKTKEFKAGFDPNSQKQMMGRAPTPPGA